MPAGTGASREVERSRGPIDEGVVEGKPFVSKIHRVGRELSDAELDGFVMISDGHMELDDFSDSSLGVLGSIGISDGDGGDGKGRDTRAFNEIGVDYGVGAAGVEEGDDFNIPAVR